MFENVYFRLDFYQDALEPKLRKALVSMQEYRAIVVRKWGSKSNTGCYIFALLQPVFYNWKKDEDLLSS